MFDVVIPLGPNDTSIISKQLEYTRKNIIGRRNIYIISHDPTLSFEDCITISEALFPFSIDTVAMYHGKNSRNGWYLQQLLKLYAGVIIPGILPKYLVVDSDTFFLKPVNFINSDGKLLYNTGSEFHMPYFIHMKKLHPTLMKVSARSGICHHMIFDTERIKDLFHLIESNHPGKLFFETFLKQVTDVLGSGASEYEIYFNFMIIRYPSDIVLRPLRWKNTNTLKSLTDDVDYVSYHWYARENL